LDAGADRGNSAKSALRARIEHVFARQKDQIGLFNRTIGVTRAEAKISLANLAYTMDQLIFHEGRGGHGIVVSDERENRASDRQRDA
jgi:hypothetical protein